MLSVSLVGYTNAGKSTLMRALTGSEVLVANKLFATLDTTVRTLVPEGVPRVLVNTADRSTVTELLVAEGDSVADGQWLVRLN